MIDNPKYSKEQITYSAHIPYITEPYSFLGNPPVFNRG